MTEQQIRGKSVVRHLTPGGHASAVALVEGNAVIRVALAGDQSSATWPARAKAGRALRHPSIAKLMGARPADPSTGEPAFVAAEFIDGATLTETAPALSQQEADRIARSLAAAIKALHDADLPHGRIHPANIRLRPDMTPVLLDVAATWGFEPTKDQDVPALVALARELDLTVADRALWDSLTGATTIDQVMAALSNGGPTPVSAPVAEQSVAFSLATPEPAPHSADEEREDARGTAPTPPVAQEAAPWEGLYPSHDSAPLDDDPPLRIVTFDPTPTPEDDDQPAADYNPAVDAPAWHHEPPTSFTLTAPRAFEPYEAPAQATTHTEPADENHDESTPPPVPQRPVTSVPVPQSEPAPSAPTEPVPAPVRAPVSMPTAPHAPAPVSEPVRDVTLTRAADAARAARDEALAQVDELTERLTDVVNDLATAHSELDEKTVRLERLTSERDDLARDLAAQSAEVANLTSRLNDVSDADAQLAAAQTAAADTEQRLHAALGDLAAAQQSLEAAEERVAQSETLLAEANSRAARAEQEAANAHARADAEELARVEMTRERARSALAAASNTDGLRELNAQIARLREDLEQTQASLTAARADADRNAADAAKVRDIEAQMRTVEAESASLRRLTTDLSARLTQAAGGAAGSEQMRAELEAAAGEVARLRQENAAFTQRIAAAEAAARAAQGQVAAAQDHARRFQEHATQQIEAARAAVAQSAGAPAMPSAKEEAYQQEIASLTQSLQTVTGQREALAQRVETLEEAAADGESGAVKDLYAKLSLMENELSRARAQISDLTSQLDDAAVTNAHLVEVRSAQAAPPAAGEPIPLPVNPGPAAFMQARPGQHVAGPPAPGAFVGGPPPPSTPQVALPPAPALAQGGAPTPGPGGDGGAPSLLRLLRQAEASGTPTQLL